MKFGIVWPTGVFMPKNQPNQTKLENILSFPKNLTLSLKSDQINLFTNIWSNRIKNYRKKQQQKTHALKPT